MTKSMGGNDLGLTPGIAGTRGLNNIGLLVKIAGHVATHVTDGFYLDDGSKLTDETGITGIKVWTGVNQSNYDGANVVVTGIVSCRKVGTTVYRQILATHISTIF
jgi:hypothetical protein